VSFFLDTLRVFDFGYPKGTLKINQSKDLLLSYFFCNLGLYIYVLPGNRASQIESPSPLDIFCHSCPPSTDLPAVQEFFVELFLEELPIDSIIKKRRLL